MMTTLRAGEREEWYVYDSNNERVLVIKRGAGLSTDETRVYSIRGGDQKVLREVTDTVSGTQHQWAWKTDYALANGRLLAAITPGSGGELRRHFHPDHLGTPLFITDDRGFRQALHKYFPFGREAPGSDLDDERMKFTGHERDFGADRGQDLDYMHARHYSAAMGRFLSVDPTWNSADLGKAQSWNRYAYVVNNPMRYTDPTGQCIEDACVLEFTLLAAAFVAVTGTEAGLHAPSGVPGKTNAQVLGSSIGTAIDKLGDAIVTGIRQLPAIAPPGYGGGADPMPPVRSQQETFLPELPARDSTGKVHGDLPTPADLRQYTTDELQHFQDELKGSVGRRIDVTSQKGPDQTHGERQAEEQRLIRQIEKILKDREERE